MRYLSELLELIRANPNEYEYLQQNIHPYYHGILANGPDDSYYEITEIMHTMRINAYLDYYVSKNTYYIQIGGYGLYYMKSDPAKLGVPKFNPVLKLRIRLKRGGVTPIYNYRFTTALQVKSLQKSDVNLENKDYLKALAARNQPKGK
jgi:hypothetical protein